MKTQQEWMDWFNARNLTTAHLSAVPAKRVSLSAVDIYEIQYDAVNDLKAERDELREALDNIVYTWAHQSGRVFESMGSDNPRALLLAEVINKARALLAKGKG